jgi:RNA polymerase sigma-70 factor (ECF subfamily)
VEIPERIEALHRRLAPGGGRAAESQLVERLKAGDDAAFAELIDRLGGPMLRVARLYVGDAAVAEEVVQETWVRVLRSLGGFEGRSSLKTWIFVILGNCARRRAERERRYLAVGDIDDDGPDSRFFPPDHPRWAGMWTTRVDGWAAVPDERLIAGEGRARLHAALDELPPRQAAVFVLRDVEGWDAADVCELLELTEANQRVLLHRARAQLRAALEVYLGEER